MKWLCFLAILVTPACAASSDPDSEQSENPEGNAGEGAGGSENHGSGFGTNIGKGGFGSMSDAGDADSGASASDPDAGDDPAPHDDAGADADIPAGPDTTAPEIQSLSPEQGAAGVTADAQIVIEFSEPMNTASVEAAFDVGNLPDVDFSWNTQGSVLTVAPQLPLLYAEGYEVDTLMPESFDYGFVEGAQDLAGNALPAAHFDFTTLRRISSILTGLAALDGFAQADGNDDHNYDEELVVGSSNDVQIAGFLTLDVSPLPQNIVEFETARLRITQTSTYQAYGAYTELGDLYLEHVIFPAVESDYVITVPLRSLGVISTTPAVEVKQRDVRVALTEDYEQRATRNDRSQYRLVFQNVGASDAGYIAAGFATAEADFDHPQIEIIYLLP